MIPAGDETPPSFFTSVQTMKTVFVLTDLSEDGKDIIYRLATEENGLSPLYRLEKQGKFFGGNPFSLYGKQAKQFAGADDIHIVVCQTVSNKLS